MSKNNTRLASLMGTWTVDSTIRSNFGVFKIDINFVIYLMGDPMRENSCQLPPNANCSELENKFCLYDNTGDVPSPKCASMEEDESNWSDVVSFIYFGVDFDLGSPINRRIQKDTGGWMGPIGMVLARNMTDDTKEDDVRRHVVDRYEARYVRTPLSSRLIMSPNMTMLSKNDFNNFFGEKAVNSTTAVQSSHLSDPFEPYWKTCDNGSVEPILPLYQFEFIQDPHTGNETINVKIDYKLLTIPDQDRIAWKFMPTLARRGLPVKGPYCYEDELRGWVFDLPYDSNVPNKYLTLQRGCVEGLPCVPLGAQLLKPLTKVEIQERDGGTTVDFRSVFYLTLVVIVLSIGLVISLVALYRSHQMNQSYRQTYERFDVPLEHIYDDTDATDTAEPSNTQQQHRPNQQNDRNDDNENDDDYGKTNNSDHEDTLETPLLSAKARKEQETTTAEQTSETPKRQPEQIFVQRERPTFVRRAD